MAATAPASASDFLELLKKSALLSPERTATLPAPDALPAEPPKAAATLVKAGFLTKFQATQLLAGRHKGFRVGAYVVQDQLGRGGMGAVYLAEHLELKRKVAIKVLAPGKGDDQKLALERFLREARAAAALDHPNIVRIFDVARHNDAPYLVMEYVEGETLQQVIDRDGAVPYTIAAEYISQAAAGLQHASEKGFVHRDIKPGNLIRDKSGTVKILDMGLARSSSEGDKLTEQLDHGAVVGTADFIAPEQAINSPDVDVRADIYSLGATFFSLIIGKPPFGGNTTQKLLQHQLKSAPTLASLDATLPKGLSAVVSKMLSKKPELRYQTPADVIAALTPWTGNSARILAGLSKTNLGKGADLHAALMERANSSTSMRLHAPVDPSHDPAVDSSVVDPSEGGKTTAQMSASETVRNQPPQPSKLPPKLAALWNSKYGVLTFAGAGVVLLMLLGALIFGGRSEPTETANKPSVEEPQPQPQPQPQPPPPPPKTTPKQNPPPKVNPPREEVVYRLDPAALAAFQVRLKGGNIVEGKRAALPAGVAIYALKDGEAEFKVGPVDGSPALSMTRHAATGDTHVALELERDAASQGMGLKLKPDNDYKVRVRYRAPGASQFGVSIHTLSYKNGAYKVFPATGDTWATVELPFRRGSDPMRLTLAATGANGAQVAIGFVELIDARPDVVRHQLALAEQQPFVARSGLNIDPNDPNRKTARPVSHTGPGSLPAGWSARCYNKDTEMESFAETVEGRPVLGIRNVQGPGSAMLFMPQFECPSATCRLRIEYAADVREQGFIIRFKPGDQRAAFDIVRPPVGGTNWRTQEWLVDLKGASGGFFEFHNTDPTPSAAVRIRALDIIEPNPVNTADRVVFKLDANDLPGFRNTKLGRNKTSGENDPRISGVYFGGWKGETENEWICAPHAGAKALGYTNLNDVISAQIGIELEAANGVGQQFTPGQIVRLRVTYRTTGRGRGSIYFQNADDKKVPARATLSNSNNAWKTVDVVMPRGNNPLRCLIDSSEQGSGNMLYVRTVTVAEVGTVGAYPPVAIPVAPSAVVAPMPVTSPNDPVNWAEGPSIYTLDVSKIPAFRVRKEKGMRIGGDAEQLPAGVGCQCWKEGAVGEFRRDTHTGSPALGFTNLNNEKSSQFTFALEGALKLPLQPGKAYRVKVEYRTENDATGTATVHVVPGYKGLASATLTASTGQWKTATASFTRPPVEEKVELRMVIDNTAVGEGNTLWVKSVEVVELIPPQK